MCIELLLCSVQLQCPCQLAASVLASIHVGTIIWFHHLLNFKIRVHGETVNIEKRTRHVYVNVGNVRSKRKFHFLNSNYSDLHALRKTLKNIIEYDNTHVFELGIVSPERWAATFWGDRCVFPISVHFRMTGARSADFHAITLRRRPLAFYSYYLQVAASRYWSVSTTVH